MVTNVVSLAQRFANSLDCRDYDALYNLLDSECTYEVQDRLISESEAIVETYRRNTEWAFDAFDRIEFESSVLPESDTTARVTFVDRLYFGSMMHEYRCQQIVRIDNRNGRIVHIFHVDLATRQRLSLLFSTNVASVRRNELKTDRNKGC